MMRFFPRKKTSMGQRRDRSSALAKLVGCLISLLSVYMLRARGQKRKRDDEPALARKKRRFPLSSSSCSSSKNKNSTAGFVDIVTDDNGECRGPSRRGIPIGRREQESKLLHQAQKLIFDFQNRRTSLSLEGVDRRSDNRWDGGLHGHLRSRVDPRLLEGDSGSRSDSFTESSWREVGNDVHLGDRQDTAAYSPMIVDDHDLGTRGRSNTEDDAEEILENLFHLSLEDNPR